MSARRTTAAVATVLAGVLAVATPAGAAETRGRLDARAVLPADTFAPGPTAWSIHSRSGFDVPPNRAPSDAC